MSRPMVKIHNAENNEVIEREMNDAEIAQYKADELAEVARQTELAARTQARLALLDKLGLSEEEAKLLLG